MRLVILGFLVVVSPLLPLEAQRRVAIAVELPPRALLSRDAPLVTVGGLLSGKDDESLIRSGFAAHMRFRAELWPRGGLFSSNVDRAEWRIIVDYEPLERVFRIVRQASDGNLPLGTFSSFEHVQSMLALPYRPLIRAPVRPGRYYYTVTLEVERMTANDLAELRNWTDGELRPAIRGERNPGSAIANTLGTIFTHLIGTQKKKYRKQSGTFAVQ